MPAVSVLHRVGDGEVDPDAVLRNSDRSAQDGSGPERGQHHAAGASGNFEGAEDAGIVVDRRAGRLDEEEHYHPGGSYAALGAVRYLLVQRAVSTLLFSRLQKAHQQLAYAI